MTHKSRQKEIMFMWYGQMIDNPQEFDIFFSFSHDGGQTFSTPPDNISNNTGRSHNPQISSDTETQQQSTN